MYLDVVDPKVRSLGFVDSPEKCNVKFETELPNITYVFCEKRQQAGLLDLVSDMSRSHSHSQGQAANGVTQQLGGGGAQHSKPLDELIAQRENL